jgi:recombination protein RecA
MRKLTAAISRSNTCVIFINQLREKIGVMFGNPETTTGGRALKFYASVRMDIRKIDSIKQGLDVVGNRVKVKVVKNKVAAPFRVAEFDIMYNEGISYSGSVLDIAIETKVIDKSGAWFSYGEMRLGQGRENVRDFLRQNLDLLEEIAGKVKVQSLPEVTPVIEADANGAAPPVAVG